MKIAKIALALLVVLGALYVLQRSLQSHLGTGPTDELAGVILAPPPGYRILERGELSSAAAATELEREVLSGSGKVGIHFERQGASVYWLADPTADLLEERSAGAGGTRLATLWRGGLRNRLAWARAHGDPDAPGLPLPEQKNLYH